MTSYEMDALLDDTEMQSDRAVLELLRTNAYITALCGGAKIKLTDIAQFPWDEKEKPMSTADIQTMQQRAQEYKKYLTNGNEHED